MDIVSVAVFNELSEGLIGLEVLIEAAEYATSHHDTALLEAVSDQLLLILRLAAAATHHHRELLASADLLIDSESGGARVDYLVACAQGCGLSGKKGWLKGRW